MILKLQERYRGWCPRFDLRVAVQQPSQMDVRRSRVERSRHVREIMVVLSAVLILFSSFSPVLAAASSAKETDAAVILQLSDVLYPEVERLVREHYPKAKITRSGRKIHFDFK